MTKLITGEYEIPAGMDAEIKDGKIIVREKESEDERIIGCIKKIVGAARHSQMDLIDDEAADAILSWLEKQKEQKPAELAALQKAFVNSKKDYTLEEKCDASDYADTILPTSVTYGENDEEYKLHKIIEAAFIAGKKMAQKPAEWSEEDEKMIKSILFVLESYVSQSESASSPSLITTYPKPLPEQPASKEQPGVDLEKAARNVYESWMGGTMDDVRRDMVELGKVLNARKEDDNDKEREERMVENYMEGRES